MDWLEPFLPFVLLALYFLSWIRKQGRQAQHTEGPSPSVPEAPRASTPFEELIRQIQHASEEAKRAEAARRAEATRPTSPLAQAPGAVRSSPAPSSLRLAPSEPEFHALGAFDHEEHGFGPSSPFSEEAFEHLARGTDVTEHAPGHLLDDAHGLFGAEGLPTPARHPLVERLRHPDAVRDAFALREILDTPRARRRLL